MKTIVFSDTHLTDVFEPKKFEYLAYAIDDADQVVINGDLWDSYFIDFDQFVKSEWKMLFPLLKSKKTIYLYGNHDDPVFTKMDERVELFSHKQGDTFKMKSKKMKFHIEHGHRMYPELREKLMWLKKNKLYTRYFTTIWDFFDGVSQKVFQNSVATKTINSSVKAIMQKFKRKDEYFVMGHSHCHEVDKKQKYINTGANRFGVGNYLLIDNGHFKLVNTTY